MARNRGPKKSSMPKSGLYVDTHSHLLPGVDDGVEEWEETLACLEIARRERIAHICVTPHIRADRYPENTPEALQKVFARFKEEAESRGIGASLGSEAFFSSDLVKSWGEGELIALGEMGKYLLIELPNMLMPPGIVESFFNLRIAGVEPVLAHAERYPWAQKDVMRLGPLALSDVPFQITTHSLTGQFGAEAPRAAFEMLERGWVAVAASDAHSQNTRAPMFREAVRILANRYGSEAARLLCCVNPRRLLQGEPLLPVTCVPRRRFFRR
jgi:protein-tyrosine phosphatase